MLVKLKDVCKIKPGYAFNLNDFGHGAAKCIKITNISFSIQETELINVEENDKLKDFIVNDGDIIMSMTSATQIGKIGRLRKHTHTIYLNQRLCKFEADETKINKDYLFFVLSQNNFNKFIRSNADSKSLQQNISHYTIGEFTFELPNLKIQNKIAEILSNIDNQIERNNTMVKRLQDLILTKYSIDFEQKMIVNGCVKDICKLPSGFSFKPEMYIDDGKYNLVTIKNVSDIFVDTSKTDKLEILPKTMKDFCKLTKGDVLMSLTGNVGRISIVVEDNNLLNQRVSLFDCKEEYKTYIYALLNSQRYQIIMQKMARGTSQKNLSPIDVEDLQIYIPNDIKEFSNVTTPIFNEMVNIQKQTNELNNLKQQLLPLLINGQIII